MLDSIHVGSIAGLKKKCTLILWHGGSQMRFGIRCATTSAAHKSHGAAPPPLAPPMPSGKPGIQLACLGQGPAAGQQIHHSMPKYGVLLHRPYTIHSAFLAAKDESTFLPSWHPTPGCVAWCAHPAAQPCIQVLPSEFNGHLKNWGAAPVEGPETGEGGAPCCCAM